MPAASAAVCIVACIACATVVHESRGDEVTYRLPDSDVVVSIPGTIRLRRGMIAVTNGRHGGAYFSRDEVDYVRTRSDRDKIPKLIRDAAAEKDAEALLAAGGLALKAGRPDWFRQALAALNQFAPQHTEVARLTQFVAAYDAAPVWDPAELEKATFGANPPNASLDGRRVRLYVVDASPDDASKKLAEDRIALMERVSETYFFVLALDGVELSLPDRPLVGVWCAKVVDYDKLRASHGPKFAEATGFYAADPGVSVFFDQSTGPRFASIFSLAATLQRDWKQAKAQNHPNIDEIARRAAATQLVARVAKERADVETVAHESVHQLLALSGLLPADSHPPRSLHEGIATYFEGYDGADWAGPGALLKERHARLIELMAQPDCYSLADVLDDGMLVAGAKPGTLDAYAYAWGATYFLAQTRPAEFFRYCRSVGKESQRGAIPPGRLRQMLADATGADLASLDAEWRSRMRDLAPPLPASADSP
ncbi:MAG TPA: DUF1570 domain-containing protein [Pirellulaceae bacterium]|jgi:hypothetical protein|nr:DUF1570 domain-containing protein [Pirellulaceae bacterium]